MARGRPKVSVTPCRFCNMQFKRVEHLQRHERIHTQEKPFSCDCGQKFSRRDLLMRHRRLSHHEPPTETTAVNTSQGETEQSIPVEIVDRNVCPLPSLVPDTGPAEHCSALSSAPVSDMTFDHAHFSQLMPLDPTSSLGLDSTYEFEFLWNNSSDMTDFLPTTFFDTDYSLSDIWQSDNIRINGSGSSAPAHFERGEKDQPPSNEANPMSFESLSSRLPPLEPDSLSSHNERLPHNELDSPAGLNSSVDTQTGLPWNICSPKYDRISAAIRSYDQVLPKGIFVPSRHTVSRYIEGYFRGFHEHFPFLHPSTLKIETLAPELILAVMAMGAFCRVEKRKGYELYLASKTIIMHKLEQRTRLSLAGIAKGSSNDSSSRISGSTPTNIDDRESHAPAFSNSEFSIPPPQLQLLQSLIILIAMATWADIPAAQDALAMGSQLSMLTRAAGLQVRDEIVEKCAWSDWIRREGHRRTLFVAYIILNLTSITFNVSPLIMNDEIRLSLPHCNVEWVNTSAVEWQHTRETYGHTECQFDSTLAEMIAGRDVHYKEPLSALGNYALINALIQCIYFERQTTTSHTIRLDTVKRFESALQTWQRSWEATQETSLDPSSPNGPLGFNSAALLRLAYLRLNANLGPCRNLLSQDPKSIALLFTDDSIPLFTRSLHVDRAVLQCIHALSIPIRIGIAFVACTQSVNGSIQYPLCTLECALLLSRWLSMISNAVLTSGLDSLREDERKLLAMIASLIRETDMANTLESKEADSYCIRRMAATVVRLWAETFQGVHIFEIVRVIGETLSIVAELLEKRLE
ncbi:hypothetical protein PENFLA_c079G05009 [Penicillium flavigenum]|uniref:C2H2-type domain-containing protein n=1 Tax=Penicillium flavigenum TaxID=254877 RepID=A0A1V6SBR8_9EURO|nr:hypothetical protein PENFLA_c079G05009 [Penicillium flavigenum]